MCIYIYVYAAIYGKGIFSQDLDNSFLKTHNVNKSSCFQGSWERSVISI